MGRNYFAMEVRCRSNGSFLVCGYGRLVTLKSYHSFVMIQMTLNSKTAPIFISLVKLLKFKASPGKLTFKIASLKKAKKIFRQNLLTLHIQKFLNF